MAAKSADKDQGQSSTSTPGPDVMLGVWAAWMDRISAPAQATAGEGQPWWQMTADAPVPDTLTGGVKQLEAGLSSDPTLRSIVVVWT